MLSLREYPVESKSEDFFWLFRVEEHFDCNVVCHPTDQCRNKREQEENPMDFIGFTKISRSQKGEK
jgi:hypothetical protein